MNLNFNKPLEQFRDYFITINQPVKAEMCNQMLTELDNNSNTMTLTMEECNELSEFFFRAGWIGYEHAILHTVVNKIQEFVKKNRI
jgi:hypothetical protein